MSMATSLHPKGKSAYPDNNRSIATNTKTNTKTNNANDNTSLNDKINYLNFDESRWVNTPVKKYFPGKGWLMGSVVSSSPARATNSLATNGLEKLTSSSSPSLYAAAPAAVVASNDEGCLQSFQVHYDAIDYTEEYPHYVLVELITLALIQVGSLVVLYSYEIDRHFHVIIQQMDDTKTNNLLVAFETSRTDWIDLRKFKFQLISFPSTTTATTTANSKHLPKLPVVPDLMSFLLFLPSSKRNKTSDQTTQTDQGKRQEMSTQTLVVQQLAQSTQTLVVQRQAQSTQTAILDRGHHQSTQTLHKGANSQSTQTADKTTLEQSIQTHVEERFNQSTQTITDKKNRATQTIQNRLTQDQATETTNDNQTRGTQTASRSSCTQSTQTATMEHGLNQATQTTSPPKTSSLAIQTINDVKHHQAVQTVKLVQHNQAIQTVVVEKPRKTIETQTEHNSSQFTRAAPTQTTQQQHQSTQTAIVSLQLNHQATQTVDKQKLHQFTQTAIVNLQPNHQATQTVDQRKSHQFTQTTIINLRPNHQTTQTVDQQKSHQFTQTTQSSPSKVQQTQTLKSTKSQTMIMETRITQSTQTESQNNADDRKQQTTQTIHTGDLTKIITTNTTTQTTEGNKNERVATAESPTKTFRDHAAMTVEVAKMTEHKTSDEPSGAGQVPESVFRMAEADTPLQENLRTEEEDGEEEEDVAADLSPTEEDIPDDATEVVVFDSGGRRGTPKDLKITKVGSSPVFVLKSPPVTSIRKHARLAVLWDQNDEYYGCKVLEVRKMKNRTFFHLEYLHDSYKEWTVLATREFYVLDDFLAYESYLGSESDGRLLSENIKKIKRDEEEGRMQTEQKHEWLRDPFTRIELPSDHNRSSDLQTAQRRTVKAVQKGCRVAIWWPSEKKFYKGIVENEKRSKRGALQHYIHYDDGEKAWVNFENNCFIILVPPETDCQEKGYTDHKPIAMDGGPGNPVKSQVSQKGDGGETTTLTTAMDPDHNDDDNVKPDLATVTVGSEVEVNVEWSRRFRKGVVKRVRPEESTYLVEFENGLAEWLALGTVEFRHVTQPPTAAAAAAAGVDHPDKKAMVTSATKRSTTMTTTTTTTTRATAAATTTTTASVAARSMGNKRKSTTPTMMATSTTTSGSEGGTPPSAEKSLSRSSARKRRTTMTAAESEDNEQEMEIATVTLSSRRKPPPPPLSDEGKSSGGGGSRRKSRRTS